MANPTLQEMIDGAAAASAAAWGSAMKPAMDKSCLVGTDGGNGSGVGVTSKSPRSTPQKVRRVGVGNGNKLMKRSSRPKVTKRSRSLSRSTPQRVMKRSRSLPPVETGAKKKKKKLDEEKKTTKKKSRQEKCHAMEILAQRISHPNAPAPICEKLKDIAKDAIDLLPLYDTSQTSRRLIVASTAQEGERAIAELWADLGLLNDGGIGGDGVYRFIGFDTETKPNWTAGNVNPVALIQIATATTAYLFRLTFRDQRDKRGAMTESLMNLLADHRIIKVGVGVKKDGEELNEMFGPECCNLATFMDLGVLAKLRWPSIHRPGLRNLTGTLLGKQLSKAQQCKNWAQPKLTLAMKHYASNDAHIGLDLLCTIVGFPGPNESHARGR